MGWDYGSGYEKSQGLCNCSEYDNNNKNERKTKKKQYICLKFMLYNDPGVLFLFKVAWNNQNHMSYFYQDTVFEDEILANCILSEDQLIYSDFHPVCL